MSPDSLAVRLRQARGAMSLAEAADRAEMSENRLRLYEEGRRQPYRKTLRRLADVYDVPVRRFMEADDAPGSAGAGSASGANGGSGAGSADAPRRRRRRRRTATVGGEDSASVEVPVEIEPGREATVNIKLVIRAKGGVRVEKTGAGSGSGANGGDAAGGSASAARVSAGEASSAQASASRPSDRPEPDAPDGESAADAGLDGVRRAYQEFRRGKG